MATANLRETLENSDSYAMQAAFDHQLWLNKKFEDKVFENELFIHAIKKEDELIELIKDIIRFQQNAKAEKKEIEHQLAAKYLDEIKLQQESAQADVNRRESSAERARNEALDDRLKEVNQKIMEVFPKIDMEIDRLKSENEKLEQLHPEIATINHYQAKVAEHRKDDLQAKMQAGKLLGADNKPISQATFIAMKEVAAAPVVSFKALDMVAKSNPEFKEQLHDKQKVKAAFVFGAVMKNLRIIGLQVGENPSGKAMLRAAPVHDIQSEPPTASVVAAAHAILHNPVQLKVEIQSQANMQQINQLEAGKEMVLLQRDELIQQASRDNQSTPSLRR